MKFKFLLYLIFFSIYSHSQSLTFHDTSLVYSKNVLKFTKIEDFKNATIGIYAYDLKNKQMLANYNSDLSIIPASIQKLITTATALEILGKDYVFKTYLEYDGYIDSNKTLHGNLYIRGDGDPSLGSEYFAKKNDILFFNWITKIKEAGIDSINGNIIADDSKYSEILLPSTWIWGDIGNYFGAYPSALTIFDNSYNIYFFPGDSIGAIAKILKIEPKIPNLSLINNLKISSVNKDLAYIYGGPPESVRYINGTIPKTKDNFKVKGSVPNPALLTSFYMYELLLKYNIVVRGNYSKMTISDSIKSLRIKLDSIVSPTLGKIIEVTNNNSNNLFAEHLLIESYYSKFKNVNIENATSYIIEFWKNNGIITDGMFINDGSGLSRYNSFTPRQLGEILIYMKTKSKNTNVFFESLPISGKTGTLKSFCNGTVAEGKINAKSGYISRVRNYAGYLTKSSGNEIVFVIMINNFNCTAEKAKKHIEQFVIELY